MGERDADAEQREIGGGDGQKVHDTERSMNATTNQTATAPPTLSTMPARCARTI